MCHNKNVNEKGPFSAAILTGLLAVTYFPVDKKAVEKLFSLEGFFLTSTLERQNNKNPVAFTMSKSGENVFVFENRTHDFSKRIVYQLLSPDSLPAYIDDGAEGTKNIQHFYYIRQKR